MPQTSSKPRKIEPLEALARTMVGDGGTPNVFFVTVQGVVITITRNFHVAYEQWQAYACLNDVCALEDRRNGTLASVDDDEENPGKRIRIDDTHNFRNRI